MKILFASLLMFLFVFSVVGQKADESSGTAKLEIIKNEWKQEIYNPLLDEDPFQAINETKQAQQDEINYRKQTEIRAKMGLPPEPKPVRIRQVDNTSTDRSVSYIYYIKVKNTGTKEIEAITWDYVFYEQGTKQEAGRRSFVSKVNIDPNESKSIAMRSASPPTTTVNVKNAGKKMRDLYSEEIAIQTILYTDGSVWQAISK